MKKQTHPSISVLSLTRASIIAALYIVLTFLANALGLASGSIQIRFSEALTILPFFTSAAIPGLYAGCLLANILTGCALPDLIFGPIASLLGALGTYALRRHSRWLAPIPPIAANAAVIPLILFCGYGIRPLWFSFLTVTIGEVISCGIFGMILFSAIARHKNLLFPDA